MSATFEMDDNGLCIIRCDPPVNGSGSFVFQPDVLASWKALLGLASTREAIAAIMQGRRIRAGMIRRPAGACGPERSRRWRRL